METQLFYSTGIITDQVIEQCKTDLRNEIINYVTVQAAADAKNQPAISPLYFKVQILDYVQARGQYAINFIRSRLLNLSSISNAKEAEQIAGSENFMIDNEIINHTHAFKNLKTKCDALPVNHFKRKYWKLLFVCAILLGLTDGIIAFTNTAGSGYSIWISLLAAVVLTGTISFAHIYYLPWIKKAISNKQRTIRLLIVFGVVFIAFSIFGNIRAMAINNSIDVSVPGSEISPYSKSTINGWVIAMISFSAFVFVYFLSKLFYKNEKELKAEETYIQLTDEMDEHSISIDELKKERKTNMNTPIILKQEARVKHNLYQCSIAECKNITEEGVILYKQVFARNSKSIPTFFNDLVSFDFDDSIDFPH